MSDTPTNFVAPFGAPRRSVKWVKVSLVLGALTGAGVAAREIAAERVTIPADAVALVNGVPIPRAEYVRALDSVLADRPDGELREADRRRVLERLVDEELLLQRALALDLPRRDRRLRGELVSTVIADVVDSAEQQAPTEDELHRFLEANAARFQADPVIRVEQIFFATPRDASIAEVERRARAVAERLDAGEHWERLRAGGDAPPVPLTSAFLSRAALTEALGPTAARAALGLPAGARSGIIRSGAGYLVLRVLDRREGGTPELSAVRDLVRAEYVRRAGEERLEESLRTLRTAADLRVRGP